MYYIIHNIFFFSSSNEPTRNRIVNSEKSRKNKLPGLGKENENFAEEKLPRVDYGYKQLPNKETRQETKFIHSLFWLLPISAMGIYLSLASFVFKKRWPQSTNNKSFLGRIIITIQHIKYIIISRSRQLLLLICSVSLSCSVFLYLQNGFSSLAVLGFTGSSSSHRIRFSAMPKPRSKFQSKSNANAPLRSRIEN